MIKYHINPETGRVNQCTAKKRCRFGEGTKHYDTKEEARAGYESSMKDQAVSKPLTKNPKTSTTKPVIPGVPAVACAAEIMSDKQELIHELYEWGLQDPDIIKNTLQERGVNLQVIEAAERSGDYRVMAKIPSYSEITVSTDLARSELGLPPRSSTGIDETPFNKAKVEWLTANAATRGSHSGEEKNRLRKIADDAKKKYDALEKEHIRQEAAKKREEKALRLKKSPSGAVPVIATVTELTRENQDLGNEMREWPIGSPYTVRDTLEKGQIDLAKIKSAERSGQYSVTVKIPSPENPSTNLELVVSTDLARRMLGHPSRKPTATDESPLRMAKVEMDKAREVQYGGGGGTWEDKQRRIKAGNEAQAKYERLLALEKASKK